jgi:TolA-binding protein
MARINFEKALRDPKMGYNAHFYLGKIYGDQKDFAAAIDHLQEYSNLTDYEPGRREALSLIERYEKQMASDTKDEKDEQSQRIRETVDQELNRLPDQAPLGKMELRLDTLLSLMIVDSTTDEGQAMLAGVHAYRDKEFDKSIEAFYKAIEKYPSGSVAQYSLYNIGIARLRLKDWPRAAELFSQYRNRYPSGDMRQESRFFEAYAYMKMEKRDVAKDLFSGYIQKYRNGRFAGRAYEMLGDIYSREDQSSEAIEAYGKAASSAENTYDKLHALFKQGREYASLENWKYALRAFKKVVAQGRDDGHVRVPEALYRIADHLYEMNEFNDADTYYRDAVRLYPDYTDTPWGFFQMANIAAKKENYQEAVDRYDTLMNKYPEDYWAKQAEWRKKDAIWEYQYGRDANEED